MAAADLFVPLERIVAKYRRDVHQLAPSASIDAISALEAHLGRPLPSHLRTFLLRHNGTQLFRSTLCIRATTDIAFASASHKNVTLFADGPGERLWGFASDGRGNWAFGTWEQASEGVGHSGTFTPLHRTFSGWLAATITLLDSRILRPEDQDAIRYDADPNDPEQILRAGERSLHAGQPGEAERFLRHATTLDPGYALIWARLGDALSLNDRSAARLAWLRALRATSLPLPWPGAACIEPELIRSIGAAFTEPSLWEKELTTFLSEQVTDISSTKELNLVVSVGKELSRSLVHRGKRSDGRDLLSDLAARTRFSQLASPPWPLILELARLEIDLGHHDEAEALLRRLRREAPQESLGSTHLLLAKIAINRQEPWAEEILDDAAEVGLHDDEKLEVALLRIERAVRQDRLADAKRWLEDARRAAIRLPSKTSEGAIALAETDILRLEGDVPKAWDLLRRVLGQPDLRDDPELYFRLLLRLGDLASERQQPDEAIQAYLAAAEGFARHELPVREAWALLRLARLGRDTEALLEMARQRFARADIAAGIAAVDALRGDPGASLPWHLKRSTDHARARLDAQRAKPPLERSDADRPERRLGAHRLAIAACSEAVVTALSREMEACARAMSNRGHPLDPPVLQYVAAVDLLAAHRSYSASQVLLKHLIESKVEGSAWRALQGAIARSPNAALVDGLLSVVENPSGQPANAVAAAADVLGLRRERAAVVPLVVLIDPKANPISRKAAVTALGRIGDRSVVERMYATLDDAALAEQAALSLLMLGDRRGVDFHGNALHEGRSGLSGSPGEIVGRYGGPTYLLLLVRAAEGADDRALGALQGLGLLGDPRAVPTLLKGVTHRDRRVSEVAATALQVLTGHAEDMEESGGRQRWSAWWEHHEHRFRDGIRHRDGRILDSGLLLERMDHVDPWVRRTAYDELVITSGCNLPFDTDGPWRTQRAHLRAWQGWWRDAKQRLLPGHWYHDGRAIT